MYMKVAAVVVGAGIVTGEEGQSELFGGTEAERGEKMEILFVKVGTRLLQEIEFIFGNGDVLEF